MNASPIESLFTIPFPFAPVGPSVEPARPGGATSRRTRRYEAPVHQLSVRTFSDIPMKRLEWLWRGYLPAGELTVIDGEPKQGKSSLTLDIAARVSRGWAMPPVGHVVVSEPGDVLLVSAEDDPEDTIGPRLTAAGANRDRIHEVDAADVSLPTSVEGLRAEILRTGARLVVLDPLAAFLDSGLSMDKDQHVRLALKPLAGLAAETGAAIVLVRHPRKSAGTAMQRGGGSIGIIGQARMALVVGKHPEGKHPEDPDRRVVALNATNVGPEDESPSLAFRMKTVEVPLPNGSTTTQNILEWEPDPVDITADEIMAVPDGQGAQFASHPKERPHEAAGRLLKVMLQRAGGSGAATETIERLNAVGGYHYTLGSGSTVGLRREAGVESKKVKGPDGSYYVWFLPDESPEN